MTTARVHVIPWLRPLGRRVLRDWLAITLGRHILAWRPLTDAELAHELEHVRQWQRHGWRFPLVYFADSLRSRRRGSHWYRDNRFERDARVAAERTRPIA